MRYVVRRNAMNLWSYSVLSPGGPAVGAEEEQAQDEL